MNTQFLMAQYDADLPEIDGREHYSSGRLVAGLFFISVMSALLVWGVRTLMDPETLPVRNVRIQGEFRHLSPEALQSIVTGVVRGGFFNVNVETIRNVLFQNPWVHRVTVRRVWPDSLSVQVMEQTAIARWGEQGLINSHAELFSPDKRTFPVNLPVFTGPADTYSLLLDRFMQIRSALKRSNLKIAGLTLNDRGAWAFKLVDGPTVILGRKNVSNRVERFARYTSSALGNKLKQIEIVDLRYTNGFAVRWRQERSFRLESGQDNHG
ncbi:MAG: cell division protein FtsQ/DivIB [Gammaproteobacteria bacterium]